MARIRYLKPDFFKDEDLADHPFWIRLLFEGLWTIADKEGRLEDRIKRIKADLFPYDEVDVESGLSDLAKEKKHGNGPFIYRYEINNEKYIQIINWQEHQKPHHTEKDSVIPPYTPPKYNGESKSKSKAARSECCVKEPLINGGLTVKEPLKSTTRFVPPSCEEVKTYCAERNNGIDPEAWINHYQAKGWMIGKTKMKDWKAAVRTWERNNFNESRNRPSPQADTRKKYEGIGTTI